MALSKAASSVEPTENLMMRMWPPVGLAMGLIATIAWSGFLAYKVLLLVGLPI